jgi:sporadic carbohydrate cluster protein (TIGR04323 family)|tara:strand:- start:76 stop:453 length:378 start_codon:yes stop_codon:yes gene_type:complete
MKANLKGYIFSRPFMKERVPQGVQNLYLREYCKRNNYNFILSSVEYCMEDSYIHLNNLISNIKKYEGILAYSLFQLPSDPDRRRKLMLKVIKSKKSFHFAIENIVVKNISSIEKIEDIWAIKQSI